MANVVSACSLCVIIEFYKTLVNPYYELPLWFMIVKNKLFVLFCAVGQLLQMKTVALLKPYCQ